MDAVAELLGVVSSSEDDGARALAADVALGALLVERVRSRALHHHAARLEARGEGDGGVREEGRRGGEETKGVCMAMPVDVAL